MEAAGTISSDVAEAPSAYGGRAWPAPPTSFVGREREVARIVDLLGSHRLVSLTGPGGTGKTRLALEAATAARSAFPDGLWLVPLEPIRDPALVPAAIARSLLLKPGRGEITLTRLIRGIDGRMLLLVLDNFEHLLPASAIVRDLLSACPRLRVLVASRARLRLYGEQEVPVPPLAVPDPALDTSPGKLQQIASVQLFLERARSVLPDFDLTDRTAPAVAALCRRLEGLPLAIELAAAWVRLLAPEAILKHLDNPLSLLVGGPDDLPARQRSLRDAIGWSYNLLSPDDQIVFRRLAVFSGGASLDAVEAVCGDGSGGGDLLARLERLVSANLARSGTGPGGEPRLEMLDTIRVYALDLLVRAGERDEARRRHAAHFLALAEHLEPALSGPEQAAATEQLERELHNLRAALAWAVAGSPEDSLLGLRLTAALWRFWLRCGHLAEGQAWLERALASAPAGDPATRAAAADGAGTLARMRADRPRARELYEEALRLRRQAGDRAGVALSLHHLGGLCADEGDIAAARACYEESLNLRRLLGDQWGVAYALQALAMAALAERDTERGLTLAEESLALRRSSGDDWGIAHSLRTLGLLALQAHDLRRAADLLLEALDLFQRLSNTHAVIRCIEALGGIAVEQKAFGYAACLLGAADALRQPLGAPRPPALADLHEKRLALVRQHVPPGTFEAMWRRGAAMTIADVARYVRDTHAGRPTADGRSSVADLGLLTPREWEVAALVGRGFSNRQIAEALVVSERTAESHVEHIMTKLAMHSRAQIAAWATERRLIKQPSGGSGGGLDAA